MEVNYMANEKLQPPRSLGRALNFATGACNAMCNDILAAYDLSLPQWVILSALWRADGLLVSEIADYTSNNGPAVSRILDRMEERDLVARQPDPADRRAVRVLLTRKGRDLSHLKDFYSRVNDVLLEGIPPEQADQLFSLLARLEDNARRTAGASQ